MVSIRLPVLLLLTGVAALFGQTHAAQAPGDPEAFRAFLRMHDLTVHPRVSESNGSGDTTTSSSSSPLATGPLTPEASASIASWKRRLGLSDPDFSALIRCSDDFFTRQSRLDAEGAAYVRSIAAAGKTPGRDKLSSFNDRRATLPRQAMQALKARLSPAGYESVSRFIDAEIRPAMRTAPLGGR
jgi:hypothetical protein